MHIAHLDAVFRAAVAAVEPAALVERALLDMALDPGPHPVTVLALGKAARAMVAGAYRVFGDSLTGVAVTDTAGEFPAGVRGIVGGHPIPDHRSVRAGEHLLAAAAGAPAGAAVLCLVSGGGSALAEMPAAGVSIADLAAVNRLLLESGAAIEEVNAVRRALSQLKGGRLGARVASSRLVTLAISDVGSAPPATIASGPTLAAPETAPSALEVLDSHGLLPRIPDGVVAAVRNAVPPPGTEQVFAVLADGSTAARAAAARAESVGLAVTMADAELAGEARVTATDTLADAASHAADVVIHSGETTVTVTGPGRGGRNHEAALAAALWLEGRAGSFLAGGTDGVDGAAGGAGAVVDGTSAAVGRRLGCDPAAYLANNDSGGYFDAVPGRIVTGPTGTNVADIWLVSGHLPPSPA